MVKLKEIIATNKLNKAGFYGKVFGLFSLMLVCSFFIFYMIEASKIVYFREKIETSERSVVQLQKSHLITNLESVKDDLFYIRDMNVMDELINGPNQSKKDLRAELEQELSKFIKVNKAYGQLRYIDETGMEVVRINQSDEAVVVVPRDGLQNKSDRYYFVEAMELDKDEVYQSGLDLNMENGQIEEPHKPMVRFAIKLIDKNNQESGVIIINYKALNLLNTFNEIANSSDGNSYLINEDGYILTGHETNNFAFMFDEDMSKSYVAEFEDEWQRFSHEDINEKTIQFYDGQGLYTATKIALKQVEGRAANWFIASNFSADVSEYASNCSLMYLITRGAVKRWYMAIPLLLISWLTITILVYKKLHLEAMTEMAQIDGTTGAFSRDAGIDITKSDYEHAIKNDLDYSVCFIDLNDLKKVNDVMGHEAGDDYLKVSVKIIKSCFRESDKLIRMGGDEFLIGIQSSVDILERNWGKVQEKIETTNASGDYAFDIKLSHGVASAREEKVEKVDELIKIADERMYVEKRRIKGIR